MTTAPDAVGWCPRPAASGALAGLVAGAESGRGSSVLLYGEPGIGKTALAQHHLDLAAGSARVLGCGGVEFEMGLDYATLHQLLSPLLELRSGLPDPQRSALESAFGIDAAAAAPPLLVGIAALGLLSAAAREQPVVCFIDDAQWADASSLQALAFVARRLPDEGVGLLFTTRDPTDVPVLADVPRVALTGLDDGQARALLAAVHHTPLDPDIADRLVLEARGNPLALVEAARVGSGNAAGDIEDVFARQVRRLSDRARSFVTLAAAEPLGDVALLAAAARTAGIDAEDAREAEDDELLVLGERVRFRHPLVRSVAYRLATPAQRRAAHAALGAATDAARDPDRRAWHLAAATTGTDEAVAIALEESAARAQAREGFASAAVFLARAASLSGAEADRTRRMLAAAALYQRAGDGITARVQLDSVDAALSDSQAVDAALLRARISFQQSQDVAAVHDMCDLAQHLDVDPARETYLEALSLVRFVDRSPDGPGRMAKAIAAAAPLREPPRPVDLLLDALVAQATLTGGEAVASMKAAVAAFATGADGAVDFRVMEHVVQLAIDLMDIDAATALADRQVRLARRHGALAVLALALRFQAITRVLGARFSEAAVCTAEAAAIDEVTGSADIPFGEIVLSAWQGDLERTLTLAGDIEPTADRRVSKVAALYSSTVAFNGVGQYDRALEYGLRAFEQERLGTYHTWMLLPELAEAASHLQRPHDAAAAVRLLTRRCEASGTDYALGLGALGAALIAPRDDRAEALFIDALDCLEQTSARAHHARALLLYGERLRRAGRRIDARRVLEQAHELLTAMGAVGFAARAARELHATGARLRKRTEDQRDARLTAQEMTIARQVAQGATTREVAAALFLSPRTVDAHLRNIFGKLDLTSRRQLRTMSL